MTWTRFMDMHSGGFLKEPPFQYIYIELPQDQAIRYFYRRFGHHPMSEACSCCGENYSIDEHEDISQLTGYDRNCKWCDSQEKYVEIPRISGRYVEELIPLELYFESDDVLRIRWHEILPSEIPEYIPRPQRESWDADDTMEE